MKLGYWTKKIRYPFGEELSLLLCLKVEKGRAVDFSIVFKVKIGNKWHFIKRCDSTKKHDRQPHCHIYHLKGGERREIIGDNRMNLGTLAKAILDDIRENYEKIIENYKYSK